MSETKPHQFQPFGESISISWDDIEATGQVKEIFRLKKDGRLGIKIHKSETPVEEERQKGNALLDWISERGVPTEHKSGLDALIEVWNR